MYFLLLIEQSLIRLRVLRFNDQGLFKRYLAYQAVVTGRPLSFVCPVTLTHRTDGFFYRSSHAFLLSCCSSRLSASLLSSHRYLIRLHCHLLNSASSSLKSAIESTTQLNNTLFDSSQRAWFERRSSEVVRKI
jgi:hypothetical protein